MAGNGEDSGRLRRSERTPAAISSAHSRVAVSFCNKSFGPNQFQIIYAARPPGPRDAAQPQISTHESSFNDPANYQCSATVQ